MQPHLQHFDFLLLDAEKEPCLSYHPLLQSWKVRRSRLRKINLRKVLHKCNVWTLYVFDITLYLSSRAQVFGGTLTSTNTHIQKLGARPRPWNQIGAPPQVHNSMLLRAVADSQKSLGKKV